MKKILLLTFALLITFCSAQNQNSQPMKNILAPYEFPTHYIQLEKGEVGYIKEGKGKETIIFIHGLSSNADAWSKNISELKNDFTCYALDLPGYGRSMKGNFDYTPTFFSTIIEEFADKLNIKEFILVGHSMGGQTAIKYSSLYPKKVKKLILVAPAGIEEFTDMEALTMKTFSKQAVFKATTNEQIEKNYALNFHQMPEDAKKMISDRIAIKNASDFDEHTLAIEKSVFGMLNDKVIEDAKKIKIPTQVFFAVNDMLIPNKYFHSNLTFLQLAQKINELFVNAKINIIPESGHFIQFEKPEVINASIKEFIKK